jgi:P27 family predicted phage terminase small subunit
MIGGRRPTPTALKVARGNPGKRPLNTNEPTLEPRLPTCPRWITGEARAEYRRAGKLLADMRVVTEADRAALAAYAVVYGRWCEAERMVNEKGLLVLGTMKTPIQNPYLSVARQSLDQMIRLCAELGLTPSSRSRLQAAPAENETDLATELFALVSERDLIPDPLQEMRGE